MALSVILPLYLYPSLGAWEPLFDTAASFPRVQFTAIVNPNSGPGEGLLPDETYQLSIERLNSLENVRTIGYVATTWCQKNMNSALDEVALYAGWASKDPSLAMSGIFFDETPTQYTVEYASYLQTLSRAVRSSPGLKDGYVVHNPGALPEMQYFDSADFFDMANLTIVFEDTHYNWTARGDALIQGTRSYNHETLGLMLHSLPDLSVADTEMVLEHLFQVGRSVYLTGSSNYTELDTFFSVFISCLDDIINNSPVPDRSYL